MKKKVLLIIAFIALLVASFVGGWYLGTQQLQKEPIKEEDKSIKENETPEIKPEVISFNKVEANEEMNALMSAFVLNNIADDKETIISVNRRNNTEILNNEVKLKLAWFYVFDNADPTKIMDEATPSGEEVTGSAGVDFAYFKDFYKTMYGEDLPEQTDYSILGYEKDAIKDNILYGASSSGMATIPTAFKANSITKVDDTYELVIDVIHDEVLEDTGEEPIYDYIEADNVEYPKELIIYNIKITYKIVNNKYILESIVAY